MEKNVIANLVQLTSRNIMIFFFVEFIRCIYKKISSQAIFLNEEGC